MDRKLSYRRQFLLSNESINSFKDWQHIILENKLYLYCHPDLETDYVTDSEKQIVLLGYLFDYRDHNKSNKDILVKIIEGTNSFESFIQSIKKYSGRYVFIYIDKSSSNILSDPLGHREIYYCTINNRIVCGSQPNLVNEYSYPLLGATNDPEIKIFYELDRKSMGVGDYWVGDETYFSNIKHLMPNHFLNLNTLKVKRYWPNKFIDKRELPEAVELSCQFLKGMMKSVTCRHNAMMAVTAGIDSRTLFSATRDVKDRIYYFINNEKQLNSEKADIAIPTKLFNELNLRFHVHEIEETVDNNFKEIFLNNAFLSSERILTTIYNVYYKNHSDKINIRGIGEIGRTRFGNDSRKLNGYFLAYKFGYRNSNYVIKQTNKWLNNNVDIPKKFGIKLLTLFYWEQRLGNWGAVGSAEADIAIEEFNPYNSHYLFEIFLSVPEKYSKYSNNIFFRKLIKEMWPELLNQPINPPDSRIKHFSMFLKKIGVYYMLWMIKYRIHYFKYLLKNRNNNSLDFT